MAFFTITHHLLRQNSDLILVSKEKHLEILYRLCHQREAAGALHAEREGQLQVQTVEDRGVHPLRVLHHDPHRSQHGPPHDEGGYFILGIFCL